MIKDFCTTRSARNNSGMRIPEGPQRPLCVCVSVWIRALAKWLKYKGKNVCVCVCVCVCPSAKEWRRVQLSMREEKKQSVHACFVKMKEMNAVYEDNHSWVYGDQVHHFSSLSISSLSSPSSCPECCLRLRSVVVVVMTTSHHCRWRALDSQDLDRERSESQESLFGLVLSPIKY